MINAPTPTPTTGLPAQSDLLIPLSLADKITGIDAVQDGPVTLTVTGTATKNESGISLSIESGSVSADNASEMQDGFDAADKTEGE